MNKEKINNRGINKTVLYSERGDKKRIRIDKSIAILVSNIASYSNKKMTQGIVSYEYLMMHTNRFTDDIDEIESDVNANLKSYCVEPELIDDVTWNDVEIPERDGKKRMNLWLPHRVTQQVQDITVWNDILSDAIEQGFKSLYDDRWGRVRAKKSLLNYVSDDDNSVTNKKARMIIENSDKIDIPGELMDQLGNYTVECPSDYASISYVLDSWDERFKALDEMVSNFGSTLSVDNLTKLLCNEHAIESERYVKSKVREFCREYKHYNILETDESSIQPEDVDSNVSVDNFTSMFNVHSYTLSEIVLKLMIDNNGSVDKDKFISECTGDIFDSEDQVKDWIEKNSYVRESYRAKDNSIVPEKEYEHYVR